LARYGGRVCDARPTPVIQLDLFAYVVQRWAENHSVLAAIIEVAEYDPAMAEIWRNAMHEVAETCAEQFRLRWADGQGRPRHPDTVAELFTWMFERSCHQILRDPGRQRDVAESMADIIWRVLDHRDPRA